MSIKNQSTTFYVIASPIGNLNEFSARAVDSMADIQYLFCEDTRTTKKLLSLLKIDFNHLKMISYHKFNEVQRTSEFLDYVKKYNCALMSDAGYPTISDPGQILINEIRTKLPQVKVEVINGSNAILCALAGSGFPSEHFYFGGFFERNIKELHEQLNAAKKIPATLIFYEAVHRIKNSLLIVDEVFKNLKVCVARELTKLNECYYFGTAKSICEQLTLKGEFVILIDNNDASITPFEHNNLNDAIILIKNLVQYKMRLKDACKYAAKVFKLESSNLYNLLLQEQLDKNEN
ncbi:16S rRNA (cytidine(1402)-2'-O)-methyltransferase [[Mycoplasma] testudinis]|uniref:16S rRNA (cytidine(1402)-2'-O)-methyltransferase n=1 Tax=[Mycoplasma] testudinis TaxID=33924 RepID=UPI000483C89D|nr:16S rRNA (cytidine(1402)-2'-O)-methyltransferase [[Mycoplasma] testudinis]